MESTPILDDIAAINRISSLPVILEAMAELTGMRMTFVARVDSSSWTACAINDKMGFGLSVGDQLDVATTLCKEVHDNEKAIVIEHASNDPFYCSHNTPKLYQIESYIALPIYRTDGKVFGTLCAIDSSPAQLPPKVVTSLGLFAELISRQLKIEESLETAQFELDDERALGVLREQFIAILGHDLRSPLTSITFAAKLLTEMLSDPDQLELAEVSYESAVHMNQMIEDLCDFSRCRLGNGLDIGDKTAVAPKAILGDVTSELKISHPDREICIQASTDVEATLSPIRFRQLVTNLLGNALTHSPSDQGVDVWVEAVGPNLRLRVRNGGAAIPRKEQSALFHPFTKGNHGERKGLGLGLYICAEIVKAHQGTIHLDSDENGTQFTVCLPL
ncbi:GAF domain-containing sensor histidine kinase [Pelagicoccus sp. SDUM812002]|uniref:GAF domain-containing sensor histidine kinase n=1 Tax=Pelagicoccus sp. SDUM812002 TaxID=3041266 RepID=UPI00280E099E|nr:GAF domain-containing sensor histidine kinase [Pelagicoccus sp. SDUM812002]MDQ8184774.1 GAF domain-containing sensor histidine kinase [Pelagicoccus sp. SDUM812002]